MLAGVCCYFNFSGFDRPKANLLRFLRQMSRDGVPIYGVELLLPGQTPATKGYQKWCQIPIDPRTQKLWQKEMAINLAATRVPPEYDNLAWLDTDIWFANPDWVKDTESALVQHHVVQMFDTACWISKSGEVERTRQGSALVGLDHRWQSHPGFAWAMRRSLWNKAGGLFPRTLSGGGDTVMALAMMGLPFWANVREHLGANQEMFRQWAENFKGISVGHVPGRVLHEWHGTIQDRDYVGRCQRVSKIDVAKDLEVAANKLLAWTDSAPPEIVREVSDYFKTRREDG
jgi:hypothetical protein